MYAIKTEKLTKKYKEKTAVSNLDLKINEGEMYGLLGVNGAGKTTTMKRLSAESAVHCSQTFLRGSQTFGSILQWSAVGSKILQTHFRLPMQLMRQEIQFRAIILILCPSFFPSADMRLCCLFWLWSSFPL